MWIVDPAHSTLGFSGTQAGATFKGAFRRFSVKLTFDPANPASGRIEVGIDTASVDTQDAERDKTIKSPDFFDIAHHPQAGYLTEAITAKGTGFIGSGKLSLRGVSRAVPIEFTFTRTAGGAMLNGHATLKRLDFGVGQGEWQSTEWVGNEVRVDFALVLKPAT